MLSWFTRLPVSDKTRPVWKFRKLALWAIALAFGLFVGDAWMLAKVSREVIDGSLLRALVLHSLLHLLAVAGLFCFYWGAASACAIGAERDMVRRARFSVVLLGVGLAICGAIFGARLRPGWGYMGFAAVGVTIFLTGLNVVLPKVLHRWRKFRPAALVLATGVLCAVVVLCGTSTPPIFPKANREYISSALLTVLFFLFLVEAFIAGPLHRGPAIKALVGGSFVFACTTLFATQLSLRSTHVVNETLEGIRALRVLERRFVEFLGAEMMLGTPVHSELKSRRLVQSACPYHALSVESPACDEALTRVSCERVKDSSIRSVLLLSVDSLRADYFGVDKRERPTFEALQAESLVFPRTVQTSSGTHLSLFSMHTGRWPGVVSPVVDAWPAAAKAVGGESATILQGWDARITQSMGAFTDDIISELRRVSAANSPFFLNAHYMSLHISGLSRTHDYGALLKKLDSELGRVLRELSRLGLRDEVIVVVTGDHGEELPQFGGYVGHGQGVRDTSTLTPLIMRVPGVAAREDATRVAGVDIWPTAMVALGLRCNYDVHGVSLLDSAPGQRPLFTTAYSPNPTSETLLFSDLHAVSVGDWKLILDAWEGSSALYNLAHDPLEMNNLADSEPVRMEEMSELLRAHVMGNE